MELPSIRQGLVCALMAIMLFNPEYVQSPGIPDTDRLIVIDGATLKSTAPVLSLDLTVLGSYYSGGDYYHLLSLCGWNLSTAERVMWAESSNNPNAINWNDYHPSGKCYGSFGLMQLGCFRGSQSILLDPIENIRMACELWEKEGWRPWGPCWNGNVNCI